MLESFSEGAVSSRCCVSHFDLRPFFNFWIRFFSVSFLSLFFSLTSLYLFSSVYWILHISITRWNIYYVNFISQTLQDKIYSLDFHLLCQGVSGFGEKGLFSNNLREQEHFGVFFMLRRCFSFSLPLEYKNHSTPKHKHPLSAPSSRGPNFGDKNRKNYQISG